jgi:hypothetical protein
MDVLHPRCCGLDVHKSSISACILLREAGRVQKHQRRFGAMTQELQELRGAIRTSIKGAYEFKSTEDSELH